MDYILCKYENISDCVDFIVNSRIESDHLPSELILKFKAERSLSQNNSIVDKEINKVSWNDSLKNVFLSNWQNYDVLESINDAYQLCNINHTDNAIAIV